MRKPIFIVSCVLLLVSLSCQYLLPENTPQPRDTPDIAQAATVPVVQAEPTQEPTPVQTVPLNTATLPPIPTATATVAVSFEDLPLLFWNAQISYDPAAWQAGEAGTPISLEHRQIPTCRLREQGPTEPPPTDRDITVGPVTYKVAELESQGSPLHWYMAVNGPNGPFADGFPTFIISSSPEQFEECLASAEEVMATLR